MGHSQRLRLCDVRGAFRLVSEVCEIGLDVLAWKGHMVEGLVRMVRGQVGGCAELFPFTSTAGMRIAGAVSRGWEQPHHGSQDARFFAGGDFSVVPVLPGITRRTGQGGPSTTLGHRFVRDTAPHSPLHAHEDRRHFGIDSYLQSQFPLPGAAGVHYITISRSWRDRPFEQRQRRIVHLFHLELGRLWTRRADPRLRALSPRLRQTLSGLLDGDAEQKIAQRLGITRSTLHKYVTALYRRFDVNGRAELLAKVQPLLRQQGPRLAGLHGGIAATPTGDA